MNKYDILNGSDFKNISKNTVKDNSDNPYAVSYIRQVLRGYVPKTSGNSQIFHEADKIVSKKLKTYQS